jgi:hypothetical protein
MDERLYGERWWPRYLSGHAAHGSIRFPDKTPVPYHWLLHFSPGNPANDSDHSMTLLRIFSQRIRLNNIGFEVAEESAPL